MPTNDELHLADQKHAAAIEELRRQMHRQGEMIETHDIHIRRLDEFTAELRESLATKDDIQGLRADIRERLDRDQLLDERLDHYRQRIVDLETEREQKASARESRFSRNMNWAVLALFAVEVIVGALQLVGAGHHA
ncbi:hypothetical protein [Paraburkholderia sp. GAS82]|uniref:hypothetical protein n=1 Tax=Paraburkholderia sp. GAS82 TaxID=3035137 RepID=UPI003D20C5D4